MKAINTLFLVLSLVIGLNLSIPVSSVSNYQRHADLLHYSNNLRTTHMNNIVFLQSAVSSLAFNTLSSTQAVDVEIKAKMKAYFKNIADNIEELNTR